MFGIPKIVPTKFNINNADIVTTNPINPEVIFFFADSFAFLSPPEDIIPMAPVIKVKINQMIAITVINPIAEDKKVVNTPVAFCPP